MQTRLLKSQTSFIDNDRESNENNITVSSQSPKRQNKTQTKLITNRQTILTSIERIRILLKLNKTGDKLLSYSDKLSTGSNRLLTDVINEIIDYKQEFLYILYIEYEPEFISSFCWNLTKHGFYDLISTPIETYLEFIEMELPLDKLIIANENKQFDEIEYEEDIRSEIAKITNIDNVANSKFAALLLF